MKKLMSVALVASLVAANNQGLASVKGFTSSDYVKNQVSALDEQDGSVTPTATPTEIPQVLGDYAVTYIDGDTTEQCGWYPAGRTTTITLKTPEDKGRLWRFVGWKDSKGDLHEAGTEVEVYDVPSATFTAVWEDVPQGDYWAVYIDGEDVTHTGWYAIGYPNSITLKEPDPKEGYLFAGWMDYKGKLHQPGEDVSISDIPSATFTAVWLKLEETVTPGAITTPTPSAVVTATPTMPPTPTPTATPTITPTMTPTATPTTIPTVTPIPTPLGDYYGFYIDGDDKEQFGFYSIGRISTITLKQPAPKEGYVFVGWKDYKGNLHQPGEEVGVSDIPSATFTAVWEKAEGTATSSAIVTTQAPQVDFCVTYIDEEQIQVSGGYGIAYPASITLKEPEDREGYVFAGWKDCEGNLHQPGDNVEVTSNTDATFTAVWNIVPATKTPVVKKAKVEITTSAKKKFVVGKKYTIKAKRTNTSKKLKWSVSNKNIATINKNTGILKAKKAGKVTITVTCGTVKDKIKIVIKKK